MIESNNPEIDVDKLMKRVKAEAQSHRGLASLYIDKKKGKGYSSFLKLSQQLDLAEEHLNTADLFSQVPQKLPVKLDRFPFSLSRGLQKFLLKVYSFLFKKQRVVNASLAHSVRELIRFNQDNQASTQAIRESVELVDETNELILESQDSIRQSNQQLKAQLQSANLSITELQQKLNAIQKQLDKLQNEQASNDSYTKIDLMLHKRLMAHLLENIHHQPDEASSLQAVVPNKAEHMLDTLYYKLEEQFRGSDEEIIQRLEPYLQLLENANIKALDSDVLDLRCGRGKWLELLKKSGYSALGLDTNFIMIEKSRARGLEVLNQDAIAYLSEMPDDHFSAITGFYMIERMQFPVLARLLGEVARVLKPGGLAIFETPNPQNVLVGTHDFYIDPTRIKPLPSFLSQFLLEQTGLSKVEILNLHPSDGSYRLKDGDVAEQFNHYFYGSQDYAVIGHKL